MNPATSQPNVFAPVPQASTTLADDFEAEAMPHMKDLYRAAFRLLRDESKANDAVQETYLSAWKSFHRYQRGTNCRAWMFQILFNIVRHERRQWFKWLTGRDEDLKDLPIFSPEPISTSLTDKDILSAVDRLPRQFREVLLLVDVEEFSYKEASTILRVPIGTVMSRISRARTLLRSQLVPVAQSYGLIPLDMRNEKWMSGANASPTRSASAIARSLKEGRSHQELMTDD